MHLDKEFIALYRSGDLSACKRLLDDALPGNDIEERASIAYWRAVLLGRESKPLDALSVLDSATADFSCRCLLALKKARLLENLGRALEAIATLQAAPIQLEVAPYPGLAWEAAYLLCHLQIKQGQTPPRDLLDLIPEDFETMIDGRFVAKSDLKS